MSSQCSICLETPPSSPLRTLPSCSHILCTICLNNLLNQHSFKCPIDNINFPETHTHIDSFPLLLVSETPKEDALKNDKKQHEELVNKAREKFDDLQERLQERMKRFEFDVEVFFHEEEVRVQEAFEKNIVYNKDVHAVLGQLDQFEMTPEYIEAYEKEEQLDYDFENNADLVSQQQDFLQARNNFKESLKNFEGSSIEILEKIMKLKMVSPEQMKQVLGLYSSEGEAKFMLIQAMRLFKMKVDDEDWLVISPSKGNEEEVSYEKIKNVEKVDIRLDGDDYTEMMILGMSFLLVENCLEKVSKLCISFCKRFVYNWEARSLGACSFWQKNKIKSLTVDFTECTLEDEETPLRLLREVAVENFEGFKLFLKNTNATEKTVNNFGSEIVPRMKNIQRFGLDFHFLSVVSSDAQKAFSVASVAELISQDD